MEICDDLERVVPVRWMAVQYPIDNVGAIYLMPRDPSCRLINMVYFATERELVITTKSEQGYKFADELKRICAYEIPVVYVSIQRLD